MDEAFLALLETKSFEYITVKEICVAAHVNRSTFYLHYETVGDLLIESVGYINGKFLSYFSHIDFDEQKISDAPRDELIFITPKYLIPWLTFIRENKRLYSTVVNRVDTLRMIDSYAPIIKKIIDPILDRFGLDDEKKRYIMPFYLEGLNAIVKQWIKDGCKKDMEELAKIIIECVVPK